MQQTKQTIEIDGKTFPFEPENLSYETSVPLNIEEATENLLIFRDVANKNNFPFLLFYGTLLGAIREKGFIKHDIDIDVVTDNESKLQAIIPNLINVGFKFIRFEKSPSLHSYTTLYSFKRSSVYIDVYIAYKERSKMNILGSYIPTNYIKQQKTIYFLGAAFQIPLDYEKILEKLYGKDWKTPVKNKPGDFIKSKTIQEFFLSFINKIFSLISRTLPKKLKCLIKSKLSR